MFGRSFQERHRSGSILGIPFRHAQKVLIRLQREHLPCARSVQLKIEAGACADFENPTLGRANDALAVGAQPLVAHGKIAEPRQDHLPVKPHRSSRNDRTP
jgi:hypothetical protein